MKWRDKVLPYSMGIGLAVIPVHRVQLMAALGLALVLTVAVAVTYRHWRETLRMPKVILFPAVVITVLALVSGGDLYGKMYAVGMLCILCSARVLGVELLKPIGIVAVIGGISVVVAAVLGGFARTGGMYQSVNYNLAMGAIGMGAVLWRFKYQWVVLCIALLGMLFTGSDEAFVVIAVVGLAVIVRRDWNWKCAVVGAVDLLLAGLVAFTGVGRLWETVPAIARAAIGSEKSSDSLSEAQRMAVVSWKTRIQTVSDSLRDIKLFGHGYAPDNVKYTTVHNVPLRVLYEIGPLGMLSWLWVVGYGLWKTTWKYAFTAVIGMSVFDHFLWTQLAPYFWVLLGVCSYYKKPDIIFRKVESVEVIQGQ